MVLFLAGMTVFQSGCNKYREDYYTGHPNSAKKLWDALASNEEYSEFMKLLETVGYDTLIKNSESYTLFIPPNEAFLEFDYNSEDIRRILAYHISPTILLPSSFDGERKLQTYMRKFVLLTKLGNILLFDGIPVSGHSMLFQNGVYYEIESIAYPRPNLYEYIQQINSNLSNYIDSRDSISLDYSQSIPVRLDDEGNIVYDSVFVVKNLFERDFFPVSQEFRNNEATMLLVSAEEYNNALDIMADNLGGSFSDHNDIPQDWQTEFLIPYIFTNGVFSGIREFVFFLRDSIENIQGDWIPVDHINIDPNSAIMCSNGLAYHYKDFKIPGNLYLEEIRYEGESFVTDQGGGFIAWNTELVSTSNDQYQPKILENTSASGGKYITIDLIRGSTELYSLEIKLPKIFPRPYKLTWRGYYRPSGILKFYVNDEYVGEFDNYNFRFPVNGINPVNFFNRVAFDVDNITSYNDIVVKIEYIGPGTGTLNGVCIDYLSLVPAN